MTGRYIAINTLLLMFGLIKADMRTPKTLSNFNQATITVIP